MIRVVERIGRVLDAFTLERPELTLTELAEATELNKSSGGLGRERLRSPRSGSDAWSFGARRCPT
jgi:DNA-binding transcriptional regulator GbsR (MarR family)